MSVRFPTTTIRLSHSDADGSGGSSMTYVVMLSPKHMPTREAYDAEVARLVKLGEGLQVDVTVEEPVR